MDIIIGIIFISIIGTLLHFMYEFSGHNKIVSLFAAVNESTWEHIKIALTPTFIWTLYDGAVYGMNENYFIAKTSSILVIIILSNLTFSYIINLEPLHFFYSYISVVVLFIIFGFYMVLTLLPIKNFLFKDPITKRYGIRGHSHHEHKEDK